MKYTISAIRALACAAILWAIAGCNAQEAKTRFAYGPFTSRIHDGGYFPEGKAPFSVRISTPLSEVQTAAQTTVTVELINTSNESIAGYIDKSGDALKSGYVAHVFDATDRHLKMTERAWHFAGRTRAAEDKNDYSDYQPLSEGGGGGWLPLRPGLTEKTRFQFSEAYTLNPGTYTLYISREDPASNMFVKSNTLTITITGPLITPTPAGNSNAPQ